MSNSIDHCQFFARSRLRSRGARNGSLLAVCILVLVLHPPPASGSGSPRARISLNAAWRFHKGDPANAEGQLAYEKIKAWVIVTSNEFVTSPDAAKPARPEGNPGANISYAQRDFVDRGWRQVNLPHDWGIEGPFDQALPGETGKLPWAGVGVVSKAFRRSGRRSRQTTLSRC
jgi:beta-galactosidase